VFDYDRNNAYSMFQMVENIRIISRHTIELSQSAITEVALMANELPPVCEEVFINFVASHFYPEIKSKYFSFRNKLAAKS
jgi:hypothetical protein